MKKIIALLTLIVAASAFAAPKKTIVCDMVYTEATPYYHFIFEVDEEAQTATGQFIKLPFYGAEIVAFPQPLAGFDGGMVITEGNDIYIESIADGDAGYIQLVEVGPNRLSGDLTFPNSSDIIVDGERIGDEDYLTLECRVQ